MKYHAGLTVNVASVADAATMPQRNPATRLTTAKHASAAVSTQAASQYVSPTLESPNTRCSAPAIQRYSGWK